MLDPIPSRRYIWHTDDAIEVTVANQPRVTRRTLLVLLAASLSWSRRFPRRNQHRRSSCSASPPRSKTSRRR